MATPSDPLDRTAHPVPAGHEGYAERLWPTPGGWCVAVGLSAMTALVVAPISVPLGVVVAVAVAAAVVTALALTTPRVTVSDGWLRAGRAAIEVRFLADPQALDAAAFRRAYGPELNALAYLCLRSWIPGGLRVEVRDPADVTPYWLVSSRHPRQLAAALRRESAR